MNLFGLDIRRTPPLTILKLEAPIVKALPDNLNAVSSWRSPYYWNWGGPIHEPFPGAWQKNVTLDSQTSILAFAAVFKCVTGIAGDIGKLRIKLSENNEGIWTEVTANQPYLPVLRKPNHYQTRIEFLEHWIVSKLLHGNAYVLKQRQDKRGIVTAMYVLDPGRVTPLVAENGDVYYRITRDDLSRTDQVDSVTDNDLVVPASEIIHDKMICLWHPLIGVSPIYACGMSATMGNKIQANSTNLFGNFSRPGGVVMFPTPITDEVAADFKARWEANFGGANLGRTAILDNGAKFEAISMPAEQAQLIEQLAWTVKDVGLAFHYPLFKLTGELPPYAGNTEALVMAYYTDCLQTLIESVEIALDEGLELKAPLGIELDLDNLWRMDTLALYESNNKASDWMKLNEQRFRANLAPLPKGGDTVYRQQQNYSIEAIAKRDAQEDPFKSSAPTPPVPAPKPESPQPTPTKEFRTEEEHQADWDEDFELEPV